MWSYKSIMPDWLKYTLLGHISHPMYKRKSLIHYLLHSLSFGQVSKCRNLRTYEERGDLHAEDLETWDQKGEMEDFLFLSLAPKFICKVIVNRVVAFQISYPIDTLFYFFILGGGQTSDIISQNPILLVKPPPLLPPLQHFWVSIMILLLKVPQQRGTKMWPVWSPQTRTQSLIGESDIVGTFSSIRLT